MARKSQGKAIWIATESSFDTDPSSNGSGYTAIPALSISEMRDGMEVLQTNYQVGQPFPTDVITGMDAWSFDFEVPFIGLSAVAGDGAAPPSADWLDLILVNSLGASATQNGEGVGTGSTSSTVVLDAAAQFGLQTLMAVYESVKPQWVMVTANGSDPTLSIAPNFASTPTTSAVAYGSRGYTMNNSYTGSSSSAFVYQDDTDKYLCTGGKITDAKIVGEVGQIIKLQITVSGVSKTLDGGTKSSLPAQAAAPVVTPLKALSAPVYFNGTEIATSKFEIDFGLSTGMIKSTSAASGRSAADVLGCAATVTIEPLRTDTMLLLKRNATSGRLLITLGAGALSGSVLNTACVHFGDAQVVDVSSNDEDGRARYSLTFQVNYGGIFSDTTETNYWRIARA